MKCKTCGEPSDKEFCSYTCFYKRSQENQDTEPSTLKSKLEAQAREVEELKARGEDQFRDKIAARKEREEARAQLAEANGQLEATTHNLWDVVGKKDALTAHVARLVEALRRLLELVEGPTHEGWDETVLASNKALSDPLSSSCAEGQRLKDAELEAATAYLDHLTDVSDGKDSEDCIPKCAELDNVYRAARAEREKWEKANGIL